MCRNVLPVRYVRKGRGGGGGGDGEGGDSAGWRAGCRVPRRLLQSASKQLELCVCVCVWERRLQNKQKFRDRLRRRCQAQ
jgi:hypothetical protein